MSRYHETFVLTQDGGTNGGGTSSGKMMGQQPLTILYRGHLR
jgi:hypothetical protein